ncbi:DUF4761 family protein [Escherichia coli]|uniref:DUF4761 family protein n=1 Tax=Escherichia coli TaxID=562 RepID=UPI0007A05C96|nr:DUF4761 family protein [Escherichia coli]EET1949853.1 DUF4761 family protein [Escherichia coli]EET8038550.1 DUF4761 family protein [Escherichia coli]EEV3413827.1 DUF4761 family protein [Escherichia coli]EFN0229770.1 DUF4761 family protein [Escherichia coli]EHH8330778.1 DUF4761 family protein [Escherichia coli]
MKQQRNAHPHNNTERHKLRSGAERNVASHSHRKTGTTATTEIHATPDGHPVKQTGKHTWAIGDTGIVIHKSFRSPVTGRFNFTLTRGDDYFGQDFTFFEALRTVDRLMTGRNFHAK